MNAGVTGAAGENGERRGQVRREVVCSFGRIRDEHKKRKGFGGLDKKIECDKETYEDNLKQHLLVDLHKLLIPLLNIGCLLAGVGVIIGWGWRVVLVMFAPFNDLFEDGLIDLWHNVLDGRHDGSEQGTVSLH